ncbi:(2Fe-2S)-binding protein [Saccharothrix variisporea]|uniref:Ferric iron reductase protein FhuF n=1 Tax=Saccharothrix variisporea TaxID=543527 RepID=A0A495XDI9_9PSEU|nr:(2Fe-2S)-binding protein [Saccharothrix variisporea]RKT71185.1 ferric iron reductase protein FhuF [Saccharothrix variisporea]
MTVPARTRAREARTPIAGSLGRANALAEWCEVRFGLPEDPVGWTTADAFMAEPARFDAWRADLGRWLVEHYGEAPERTTAGYVMSWYLSVVGMVGGTLFHQARRVPSLRPSDVAVRVADDGRPHIVAVALLAEDFACLPDDPEGDHPAATVVADEHALAALLRARFAAHAAEFVRAFGPTVRLGRRTLWAAATDALDGAAWRAGQLCGDEAAGVADAALLLPDRIEPFTSATTLRATPAGWTRRRQSCCFHFALPGAEVCDTCPRATAR